jgi:glutathione S-transferase
MLTVNRGELMSGLKIYGIARTRAFRALWMVKELGLDYEHDPVEIGDAGARTPEFLAINPNGRLPVIVDDGFVLFESLAITLYLAKKHSPGRLYPGTLEGEARAWQWSLWAVTEVDRGVNIWSLHAVRLPPEEQDLAKRAEALKSCGAVPGARRRGRGRRPYLLGPEFHRRRSQRFAAVISRAIEMDLSGGLPNLKAWLTRLASIGPPARRGAGGS